MGGHSWGYFEDVEGSADLEDRVIFYIMDVLGRPQGSYPKSFVLISLLEVCQEWKVLYVGNQRTLRVYDSRF